jgi:hypothetical protein
MWLEAGFAAGGLLREAENKLPRFAGPALLSGECQGSWIEMPTPQRGSWIEMPTPQRGSWNKKERPKTTSKTS